MQILNFERIINVWINIWLICELGDGKAAKAGLREGDVITKVNNRDVKWARHSDVVDMLQVDKLEIEIVTVQVNSGKIKQKNEKMLIF